jgi:hypothetical protein
MTVDEIALALQRQFGFGPEEARRRAIAAARAEAVENAPGDVATTVASRSPAEQEAEDRRLEKAHELEGDKQLAALGFEIVRFSHPGTSKQTPGIPDRRYYHRARRLALWWEAKSATGSQRPEQRHFQEMVEAVGEHYALGTDRDLFDWLIEHRIAARGPDGLLVSLPFTPPSDATSTP